MLGGAGGGWQAQPAACGFRAPMVQRVIDCLFLADEQTRGRCHFRRRRVRILSLGHGQKPVKYSKLIIRGAGTILGVRFPRYALKFSLNTCRGEPTAQPRVQPRTRKKRSESNHRNSEHRKKRRNWNAARTQAGSPDWAATFAGHSY